MQQSVLGEFALGFLGAFGAGLIALAVWKLAGTLQDVRRKQQEPEEDELEVSEVEAIWTAVEGLQKKAEALEGRCNQLALRLADVNVEVLDKAEKVAARLKDRERKRSTVREEVPAEDHDEIEDTHPDFILARIRAAGTLPDHRQLPLPIAETEGRAQAVGE